MMYTLIPAKRRGRSFSSRWLMNPFCTGQVGGMDILGEVGGIPEVSPSRESSTDGSM